jgi:hypothetical protein
MLGKERGMSLLSWLWGKKDPTKNYAPDKLIQYLIKINLKTGEPLKEIVVYYPSHLEMRADLANIIKAQNLLYNTYKIYVIYKDYNILVGGTFVYFCSLKGPHVVFDMETDIQIENMQLGCESNPEFFNFVKNLSRVDEFF